MATPTIIGLGIEPPKRTERQDAAQDAAVPRLDVVRQGILPLAKPDVEAQATTAQLPKVIVDLTDDTPAQRRARKKWQTFDDIGLPEPKPVPQASKAHLVASKAIVSAYRLMGIGILSIIVVALVSYIATTLFYFFSHTWLVPAVVSTADEKVVQLRSELASQQNNRDKIAADLLTMDKAILAERAFQAEFAKAIAADVQGRRESLEKVKQLAGAAQSTRQQIRSANDEFASTEKDRREQEFKAGLIDRTGMMNSKYQLAQVEQANLSLAERQAEYERQAMELSQQTSALEGLIAGKGTHALSYDVLKIKRDFDASKLETARDEAQRDALKASLTRVDSIIAGLKKSAYLRALDDQAQVALLPYANVKNAQKGSKLYACKVGMLVCHEVGQVLDVLPSEVQVESPHGGKTSRGVMVELRLTDPDAAREDVLFAGKPFGI